MTIVITLFIVEREPLEPVEPDQMPFDPILRVAKNGKGAGDVKQYFLKKAPPHKPFAGRPAGYSVFKTSINCRSRP